MGRKGKPRKAREGRVRIEMRLEVIVKRTGDLQIHDYLEKAIQPKQRPVAFGFPTSLSLTLSLSLPASPTSLHRHLHT